MEGRVGRWRVASEGFGGFVGTMCEGVNAVCAQGGILYRVILSPVVEFHHLNSVLL